ncbi:unnamed protein product [Trichobilharzia regenti]|nr:unnamed protein product [Trichobilharzia regenti]
MKVFSYYKVINAKQQLMAVGHKASFCLEDNACKTGYKKHFVCSTTVMTRGDQGKHKIEWQSKRLSFMSKYTI